MENKNALKALQGYLDITEPTVEQAIEVFTPLTIGEYDDIHVAALLTHIRTRGETFADVGAAHAFHRWPPLPGDGEGSWTPPERAATARIPSTSPRRRR